MKKRLLAIFLPVIIGITGSLAVWANEPGATQPACDKCAKSGQVAAVVEKGVPDVKAAAGCDKCPKMKAAEAKPCGAEGCAKHMKDAAGGCDKCPKMKGAEAKPCGTEGCAKHMKDAAGGCDKCPKMKGAEAKPCGEKGCDKSAKLEAAEKKPCCDKAKKE